MKKKLLIFILFILLLPITVKAESGITIKSIEFIEKSNDTEIVEEASIVDNKITFNMTFYKLDDYAKYKILVKNNDNKNLKLDDSSFINISDYIDYNVEYPNNNDVLSPNEEKVITITITYKNTVPNRVFRSAMYDASSNLNLLATDKPFISVLNTLKNISPILIIVLLIIILFGFKTVLNNKKNINNITIVLILMLLIIPFYANALTEHNISMNSKIIVFKIKDENPCTYDGELTIGTEYINGQYTYRYKQYHDGTEWVDSSNDGWGVILTDKESTDPVTSTLCSKINDKPILYMSNMFSGSKTTSIDLSSFYTSDVVYMQSMFSNMPNITEYDLSSFDIRNTVSLSRMFEANPKVEELYLRHFEPTVVLDYTYMFSNDNKLLTLNIDEWDFKNSNGKGLFYGQTTITDLSMKNVKYNTSIKEFFSTIIKTYSNSYSYYTLNSIRTLDVTGWDTSEETSFNNLFSSQSSLSKLKGIDTWDTSNVKDISNFFSSYSNVEELDLSAWDLSNVEIGDNFSYFFTVAKRIKPPKITSDVSIRLYRVYLDEDGNEITDFDKSLDPNKWYYSSSTLSTSSNPARLMKQLVNPNFNSSQSSNDEIIERIEREYDKERFEANKDNAVIISDRNVLYPVYAWAEGTTIYYYCESEFIYMHYESANLFANFKKLKYIDLNTIKTTNVNGMGDLFYGDESLEDFDISHFDTSRVRYIQYMFSYLRSVKHINLSNFDTSNVTNMEGLFYESRNIESVDISSFNTSKVTSLNSFFSYCGIKKVDISNFDTSNVTDMGSMFYKTYRLEEVKFGDFDTSKLTNASYMFYESILLKKIDMSSFDVSKATSNNIIYNTYSLLEFITPKTTFKDTTTFRKPLYDSNNNEYLQFDSNMPTQTKLAVTKSEAVFTNGSSVNSNLRALPGTTGGTYTDLKHFTRSDELGKLYTDSYYYLLSAYDSPYPIFAWFSKEDDTVFYYTEADTIYLNKNAYSMFSYLSALETIDCEDFNTSRTTDFGYMFKGSNKIKNLDLSKWDTRSAIYMNYMFYSLYDLETLNVSTWNTSNATDMYGMFSMNYKLKTINISSFDLSHVTNYQYMLGYNMDGLRDLYLPNISGTTSIRLPFVMKDDQGNRYSGSLPSGQTALHLRVLYKISFYPDGGEVDPSYKIIDPDETSVYGTLPIPTKEDSDFIGWFTKQTQGEKIEETTPFTIYNDQTLYANWQLPYTQLVTGSEVKSKLSSLAGGVSNIKKILRETDASKVPDNISETSNRISLNSSLKPVYAWYSNNTIYIYSESSVIYTNKNTSTIFSGLTNLNEIDLSMFNTSKSTDMNSFFKDCKSLQTLDISSLNLTNAINVSSMFEGCEKLTTINLAPFATNSITTAEKLFKNCKGLSSINLSSFNTTKLTSMVGMFEGCTGLSTIDLSVINTSKVQYMSDLFKNCTNLSSINFTGIDTSKVIYFSSMFYNCSSLTTLNLSMFNTDSANGMAQMFYGCTNLSNLNVSSFNTSNVSMMYGMFEDCESLTSLNLSNFDTESVTDAEGMFSGCINLETLNISSFVMNQNDSFSSMFEDCKKLKSVDISGFTYPWTSWGIYNMFKNCESMEELDMSSMDMSSNDLDINILSGMTGLKVFKTPSGIGRSFKLPKSMYKQGDNTPIDKLTSDMNLPVVLKDTPW